MIRYDEHGKILTGHWRFDYYRNNRNGSAPIDKSEDHHDGDFLFGNSVAKHVYKILSGQPNSNGRPNSLITLIRADSWMTTMLEDLPRKISGNRKGGHEPLVLKQRYKSLLPLCVVNLLDEILNHLLETLDGGTREGMLFRSELQIYDSEDVFHLLGNEQRIFTTAVKHNDGKYYIYLKPTYFARFISTSIGTIADCLLGFCTKEEKNMKRFSALRI